MSVQVARGSGEPAATSTHWPSEPGRAQLRQAPWQVLAQQTPSTQLPDWQSLAALQVWPLLFCPQVPTFAPLLKAQELPEAQSLSLVQVPVQAPATQR